MPSEADEHARLIFRQLLRPAHDGGLFEANHLVFCDETHCCPHDCFRKYGRSEQNQPAYVYTSFRNEAGPRTSAVCSMSLKGMETVTCVDINTADSFLEILEHVILPSMNPYPQNKSVLILDNARVHDKDRICLLCDRFGVLVIWLPPYSFDFNAIEYSFHVGKNAIRERYGIATAQNAIGPLLRYALLDAVTSGIACNLFRHAGVYVSLADEAWANA